MMIKSIIVILQIKNEKLFKILKVNSGSIKPRLALPAYQREYSWTKNEIEDLIQDFIFGGPYGSKFEFF